MYYYDQATEERVLQHAHYFVEEMCTVREVAKVFGLSKSTVYSDLTERLPYIDAELYEEVQILLELNKEERTYRGGKAAQRKKANNVSKARI